MTPGAAGTDVALAAAAFHLPIVPAPLAAGIGALLPGLLAILVLFSPHEREFRENIVFLWYLGGLAVGTALGLLEAYVFADRVLYAYVFGGPLLEQGAKLVFLNQRRFHGVREGIWNGGAFGAGAGATLSFVASVQILGNSFALDRLAVMVAVSIGISWIQLATGLRLGIGVLEERPFVAYGITALLTIPGAALALADRLAPDPVFAALLIGYAVFLLLLAARRWIPQGLAPESRRRVRRETRAARGQLAEGSLPERGPARFWAWFRR